MFLILRALTPFFGEFGERRIGGTGGDDVNPRAGVYFLDVGQGDSIFISSGAANVLIDSGEKEYAPGVIKSLKDAGVNKIDALIGTHPHSDHIGGLDSVIQAFDVDKIYMPRVTNNTVTFERVLAAVAQKGLRVTAPRPGDALELQGGLKLSFLGPVVEDDADLNDSSIVVWAEFEYPLFLKRGDTPRTDGEDTLRTDGEDSGVNTFLFMGDAEHIAERLILDSGAHLAADVLKVGHHGGATSTGAGFLDAVGPAYAVIQCGRDNQYGHPSQAVLDLLDERGSMVLRTDTLGGVSFIKFK